MPPSSSHYGGGSVKKDHLTELKSSKHQNDQPDLPFFSDSLQVSLSLGKSVPVEGTNVVRVPFGVRHSQKKRPAKQNTWATLVIPLQPLGSPPTPPPHAA
tara:strand:+ start:1364 stop:1663 length:300 start_codon:yes stop_codon:yes gene_type:complete